MTTFKTNGVRVLSIWAEDVPAAARFYRDVLGLQTFGGASHDHRPHFRVGETFLVILQGQPQPATNADPGEFPLFALDISDLDAAVEQLRAYDVLLPYGIDTARRYVMFKDPAGNLIELVESKAPG